MPELQAVAACSGLLEESHESKWSFRVGARCAWLRKTRASGKGTSQQLKQRAYLQSSWNLRMGSWRQLWPSTPTSEVNEALSRFGLKWCPACRLAKVYADYHKNKYKKWGLELYCKECKRKRQKERYRMSMCGMSFSKPAQVQEAPFGSVYGDVHKGEFCKQNFPALRLHSM